MLGVFYFGNSCLTLAMQTKLNKIKQNEDRHKDKMRNIDKEIEGKRFR
jgi:hypothetical protein